MKKELYTCAKYISKRINWVWSSQIQENPGFPQKMSNEKQRGCLGYKGGKGIMLPNYVGIIMNHDKDSYSTTNMMESMASCFFVPQMC